MAHRIPSLLRAGQPSCTVARTATSSSQRLATRGFASEAPEYTGAVSFKLSEDQEAYQGV